MFGEYEETIFDYYYIVDEGDFEGCFEGVELNFFAFRGGDELSRLRLTRLGCGLVA
jgi:hypothetical protein